MEKERRSSILKPQQPPNFDNGELSTTITATVKRRVSFHTVRTVQKFDVEHSKIIHSPHNEPMKLYDTTSSDGLTSEQVSGSESNGGNAVGMTANKLDRTVESFTPVTTSTPLLRLKCLNDSSDNLTRGDTNDDASVDCCNPTQVHNITKRDETTDALDHNCKEVVYDEKLDVLEVESMDMSDSGNPSPALSDATRKLFKRSAVFRHFMTGPNQRASMNDETLASNATQLIFKISAINKPQSEAAEEELRIDNDKLSVIPSYGNTADMDISVDDSQIFKIPTDDPSRQLPITSAVVNEPTDILFRINSVEKYREASNREDDSENIVTVDEIQISNNFFSLESVGQQVVYDPVVESVQNADKVTYFTDDVTHELPSELNRHHISSESLSSVRKTALESPAALPNKKIRLFSPKVVPLPKTNILLTGLRETNACEDKADPINTENTTSIDKSTDKVLTEIKYRLRHSLNQSGVFTLSELSAVGSDINMLYDIPVPEPLFHSGELRSQVSTAQSFNNELHTTAEQSYVDSSSLSSRRSEIVTAALGNESSFLTNRVDTVGFNINFRTIPCLRIKPNEQWQIMDLKQLATTNLHKRIAEVVDRCTGLISTELPNCSNRKIAECIRTLNPRKLSEKEACWFGVCYLMAQREWFVLRAKLAKLTSEKLDELLLETKAESIQQKRLAQSVRDYERCRDEVEQRYRQLKSIDEAADIAVQNEMKLVELRLAKRAGRLEVAKKELELIKKQGVQLGVLLREYDKTKSVMAAQIARKATQRANFLRKYNEDVEEYRQFLAENKQKD